MGKGKGSTINNKLKSRDLEIFKYLENKKEATLKSIADFLKVSEVTVKSSIVNINKFLQENGISEIQKEGKYYKAPLEISLKKDDILSTILKSDNIDINKEERISYILLILLFEKKINLSKLAEFFKINRLTLQDDVSRVKVFLEKFGLELKSIKWQGIYLEGNNKDISLFGIKFLVKILLEKQFHPNFSSLYSNVVNPLFYDFYRKYIDKETEEKFFKFSKELIRTSKLELGVYQFNAIAATLIYCHVNVDADVTLDERIFPAEFNRLYEKYFNVLKKTEGFKEIEYLGKNLEFIPLLLAASDEEFLDVHQFRFPSFIDKAFFSFLRDIKSKFEIEIDKKQTLLLYYLIFCLKFKRDFKLTLLNVFLEDIEEEDIKLVDTIRASTLKYFGTFYDEDLITLSSYVKSILLKYKNKESLAKRIFIVDNSFENWTGETLKSVLKRDYLTKQISVVSIFSAIDWKNISADYDFVIFLNADKIEDDKITIPAYKIVWTGIPKNKKVFSECGLIEKL